MQEQIERLSQTEYSLIGSALFDMLKECPHAMDIEDLQYNSRGSGKCICLITGSGNYKRKNVLGGFTAQLNFQIAYKFFATDDPDLIMAAQEKVEKIMKWFEDVSALPRLTDNRTITKITASDTLPFEDGEGADSHKVFAADAVMEYKYNPRLTA